MTRRLTTAILSGILLGIPVRAEAQYVTPDAQAELERMSFLLGEWRIEAKIRNAPNAYIHGSGTMSVRLDDDGETFLADMDVSFEGFDVVGTTVRRYDPERGLWAIRWVSDVGGEPHIEGHWKDGRLIEINWGADQRGPFIGRLIKRKISDDEFVVRKDRLYDDGTVLPETWVYEATRVSGG